jgi:predicted nucleic acid-binding protein
VPQRIILLDTSFIVALENRADPYHAKAWRLEEKNAQEGSLYILHVGILLEIADGFARFGRRAAGQRLLQKFLDEEGYIVAPIVPDLLDQAVALYRNRSDKEWGLTDCVSFALMQQEGIQDALTSDAHFRQAGFQALLLNE